jgi:hypothetical protein
MDAGSSSSEVERPARRGAPVRAVVRAGGLSAVLAAGLAAVLMLGAGRGAPVAATAQDATARWSMARHAVADPHADDHYAHGHRHEHADDDGVADRVEGEHGLYVAFTRDSLIVQWLTADERPGRLEVAWQGTAAAVVETPSGRSHRTAVRRAGRDTPALLRYGAAGGAVHETRVFLANPRRPPVEVRGVDTLYVVGDTHGYLEALVLGLRRTGLVNEALQWTGGHRHIVFAGDLTDRGPDVLALLWLVYRLEHEAAAAGGRVHVVLGNHETMVMMGDLRYVHEKELAVAESHGMPYDRLLDIRNTVLGRWLASKPGLIRVDRTIIAHGGVAPEFAELGLRRIDAQLAQFVSEDLFYHWAERTAAGIPETLEFRVRDDFFSHPRSLFWHRAYVQADTAGAELRQALRLLGADLMVVGHTPVAAIESRYDGALITSHTPRHGAEMVMLVRDGRALRRFRVIGHGIAEPI